MAKIVQIRASCGQSLLLDDELVALELLEVDELSFDDPFDESDEPEEPDPELSEELDVVLELELDESPDELLDEEERESLR